MGIIIHEGDVTHTGAFSAKWKVARGASAAVLASEYSASSTFCNASKPHAFVRMLYTRGNIGESFQWSQRPSNGTEDVRYKGYLYSPFFVASIYISARIWMHRLLRFINDTFASDIRSRIDMHLFPLGYKYSHAACTRGSQLRHLINQSLLLWYLYINARVRGT